MLLPQRWSRIAHSQCALSPLSPVPPGWRCRYKQTGKDVALEEVGPRFEMKLYSIKLGTIDQTDAEVEWVSKPYMNTAKKKRHM